MTQPTKTKVIPCRGFFFNTPTNCKTKFHTVVLLLVVFADVVLFSTYSFVLVLLFKLYVLLLAFMTVFVCCGLGLKIF